MKPVGAPPGISAIDRFRCAGPRRRLFALLLGLGLLAAALPSLAQVGPGNKPERPPVDPRARPLLGRSEDSMARVLLLVTDEEGAPLPGVAVTVTNPALSSYRLQGSTDDRGRFSLVLFPATAPYGFRLEAAGFNPLEATVEPVWGAASSARIALSRQGPGNISIDLYNQAVAEAEDPRATEAQLLAAIEADPELLPARLALAELYLEQKRHPEAVEAARAALALEPGHTRALAALYRAQLALKDEAAAALTFQRLAAAGGDRNAAIDLYNRGTRALALGAAAVAEETFRRALELDPGLAAAHFGLASAAFTQGRWDEAAAAAERAVALDPRHLRALKLRCDAYRAAGEVEKARAAVEAYAQVDPDAAVALLYQQAMERYQAGDAAGAREGFRKAVDLAPDHPRPHYMLGLLAAGEGDAATAREHLGRFLELAPDDPDAEAARRLLAEL